jgi:alpha-beta hydrolase superfamily lysophospholipase
MLHTTHSLQTDDGLTLHTESWLPDATPKALLLLVHGYGEHLGRYRHVAAYFVGKGYAVFAIDHRGHGQSEGLRAYVERFDQFITDLHRYVVQIKGAHAGLPLFMLGHSMGALISLAYTAQHQVELKGLIVSGAPVNADANVSPLLITVGNVLTNVIPKMPFLSFGSMDILSRDPAVPAAFNADPLTWKQPMRIRLGTEINNTAARVRAALPSFRLPLLILHGADDKMVAPSGSQVGYEMAGSTDKTLKLYPGLRHEIMNEPEQGNVFADIEVWIGARTGV